MASRKPGGGKKKPVSEPQAETEAQAPNKSKQLTRSAKEADAGQTDARDEDDQPLIFQCRKCLVVVGDSTQLLASNNTHLLLSGMSAVRVSRHAPSGAQMAASSSDLHCSRCHGIIGEVRKSPSDGKWIYQIEISSITSYQLGSVENPFDTHSSDSNHGGSLDWDVSKLSEQVIKIEKVILLFNERISKIEEYIIQNEKSKGTVPDSHESLTERTIGQYDTKSMQSPSHPKRQQSRSGGVQSDKIETPQESKKRKSAQDSS